MAIRNHTVNFGQAYGGLATVGFTVYNANGTIRNARSTTGVVEYGASTGIYGAKINYNEFDELTVIWDTGGGSPRYAVQENQTILAQIQEGTDFIRMIWNTLRNQQDIAVAILEKIRTLDNPKAYDEDFISLKTNLEGLIGREQLTLEAIKGALSITVTPTEVTVPAPVVNLPAPIVNITEREIIIPDYSSQIGALDNGLKEIMADLQSVPRETKDYGPDIGALKVEFVRLRENILMGVKGMINDLNTSMAQAEVAITQEIKATDKDYTPEIDAVNARIEKALKELRSLQEIFKIFDEMELIKPKINMLTDDLTKRTRTANAKRAGEAIGRM